MRDIYFGPFFHGMLEENFQWDRCGPLSQECERFFVQEACFYATRLERQVMGGLPLKIIGSGGYNWYNALQEIRSC